MINNPLFSFSEVVSREDSLQNISEILIYSLTTRSVIYNLGIKDPLLDVFIREIAQEWIRRIGYIPYKKSFIENIVDRSIDLYRNPELLTSVENLIDLISYYKKDPKAFEEEYVKNFIAEELEALGIRDLVNIDDPEYVKYVAYALYVMIVSKLDL
ncbi:MAG: hypothetical protein ACP5I7_03460 [Sulfolobales archaeon]